MNERQIKALVDYIDATVTFHLHTKHANGQAWMEREHAWKNLHFEMVTVPAQDLKSSLADSLIEPPYEQPPYLARQKEDAINTLLTEQHPFFSREIGDGLSDADWSRACMEYEASLNTEDHDYKEVK